ncbi:MAG: NTP transferase domain-containing protein [Deltaproteobacteria bacterium]|jgi:mannose-1-phosphate guanylyltransferase|nr:NTP transferase domain-containing protein [Deltaproteobacteria bacterium]
MYQLFYGELPPAPSALAVIMAGGSGTRFWPLSAKEKPKQFLNLSVTGKSLIQDTVERLSGLIQPHEVLVVTGEAWVSQVQQHLPQAAILAEPQGRNTAPCLGLAAIKILNAVGDVPMLCVAADNLVQGAEKLRELYARALQLAQAEDVLITIGIKPTYPETGYGYIYCGQAGRQRQPGTPLQVSSFKEKPDLETAKQYLASGDYFWNAGMLIVRPTVLLKAIEQYLPDLFEGLTKIDQALDNALVVKTIFENLPAVSIDIGVLEKAENVVMFAGDNFKWSDIGSWKSWADLMLENATNYSNAAERTVFVNSKNCALYVAEMEKAEQKKIIGVVGLENVVIVDTPRGLLVCHQDLSQEVKKIIRES